MAFYGAPRPMKTLALIFAALVTVTALAETPAQIAADYRAKAKTALEKVNAPINRLPPACAARMLRWRLPRLSTGTTRV